MRLLLVGLVLGLVVNPVFGQSGTPHVMPREQTFQRSVLAGHDLRVFTYARWHRDCSPDAPPQIALRTQPAHGTVTLRPGPSTVTNIREGAADCTGNTYQGLSIWYLPSPGFRGIDQFDWDVTDSKTTSHDTAVVEVK
jgi:hypothetical protein